MLARTQLQVDHDAWHTMRVTREGDQIRCTLDGGHTLNAQDSTFPDEGTVGLWTKADARTHFDDFSVRALRADVDRADAKQPSIEAASVDQALIARVMRVAATATDDGTVRVTWPRSDVALTVDGMPFSPAAGLTTWAAFASTGETTMVMGDVVVFLDEVDPAIDAALDRGLQITALHNRFFFDEPKAYFMHIGGNGTTAQLAGAVRAVWDAIRTARQAAPKPATRFSGAVPVPGPLDAQRLGEILGRQLAAHGEVLKVSLGRSATMGGLRFGASMGLATWAAFSGSDASAAVDGDFAMTAKEIHAVLGALRQAGIHIVALHNHMVGESPAYFFTHFWGTGPAATLARGLRAALDAQELVGEGR